MAARSGLAERGLSAETVKARQLGTVTERRNDDGAKFLATVALMLTLLSGLGVIWVAMPAAMLPVCEPGA